MGWVRVSDDFYDHERFGEVGPLGIAVWLIGLAYCNRNLTNGKIPRAAAHRLLFIDGLGIYTGTMSGRDAEVTDGIDELVHAGLWIAEAKNYTVRDYLDYQPSADEVKDQREKNAFRQSQFKKRRRGPVVDDQGEVTP